MTLALVILVLFSFVARGTQAAGKLMLQIWTSCEITSFTVMKCKELLPGEHPCSTDSAALLERTTFDFLSAHFCRI